MFSDSLSNGGAVGKWSLEDVRDEELFIFVFRSPAKPIDIANGSQQAFEFFVDSRANNLFLLDWIGSLEHRPE